jgi:hypothetical protein
MITLPLPPRASPAGASAFFILSQSGERPDARHIVRW